MAGIVPGPAVGRGSEHPSFGPPHSSGSPAFRGGIYSPQFPNGTRQGTAFLPHVVGARVTFETRARTAPDRSFAAFTRALASVIGSTLWLP